MSNDFEGQPASFQPVAPQTNGELLYGRFGKVANMNWKKYLVVAAVVVLAWMLYKKMR